MNNFKILIIYISVLVILIILAQVISKISEPVIKDTISKYDNFNDYMTAVYCPNNDCKNNSSFPDILIDYNLTENRFDKESQNKPTKSIKSINLINTLKYFNFVFDNAPRQILNLYPIAENLSFSWPPPLGTRYKLTAFPYPKSTFILSAIYETISNTVDAYTFPGWNIQRRNPYDFNNSIYNKNFFRNYQDIEVLHACYPPPGKKYPFCDDGGWWLYYAAGSGVFWNTGKCFVSLNKLSLLNDIYICSSKTRREIIETNKILPKDKQLPVTPILGLSIDDMSQRLMGMGGGKSITVAIFTIVESLTKQTKGKIPKMIGFKNLTPSTTGKPAWNNFIIRTFVIFYLIGASLVLYFTNLSGKNFKQIASMTILLLIFITFLFYIYFFVVFEDFFRGLGWMTLDMALDETGMNLNEFVSECVTGNLKNSICNSLAMVQLFDLEIEGFTYAMQYDSFILTSQPNKTGTWEVEICDLRRYDPKKYGIATDGGVCNTFDKSENNKLVEKTRIDICNQKVLPPINSFKLMTGPIIFDKTGPPFYKPTTECKCIENSNRLCTSCSGTLSGQLCINK